MNVVLLIHSTGAPIVWSSVKQDLGGPSVKIRPTNLGYPPNPPVTRGDPCDVEADVANLLASIPAEAAAIDVVGHSYGGLLAAKLIPRLGTRLRSLFLYEPVLFGALAADARAPEDAAAEARALLSHPWFLTDDARGGSEEWLEVFVDYWNSPGFWRRMPEPLRDLTRGFGWKMYQEVKACFLEAQRFEDLAPPVPTTLVVGSRSPRSSRAIADALTALNPHAKLVVLDDIGHMGPLTHPYHVHKVLDAHLRALAV
jgi:pimeloyl-ACP methyl ester carboxylesterase